MLHGEIERIQFYNILFLSIYNFKIQYTTAQIQHRQFYHTFYSVHIQFATAANQPRQFSYVTQTILLSHFLHQISPDNFTVMPRQFYYAICFKQYTICHCDLLAQTICHWYVSCIYNYTLVPRQLYTGTQTIIHCCLGNFPVLIIQPRQFSILDNFTTSVVQKTVYLEVI